MSTVSNSPDPVLLGDWLAPGCHVNLVGAHRADHREIDSRGMARCCPVRGFPGKRPARGRRPADSALRRPGRRGTYQGRNRRGIGRACQGRANGLQITVYKSLGLVAQDLYAAEQVFSSRACFRQGTACRISLIQGAIRPQTGTSQASFRCFSTSHSSPRDKSSGNAAIRRRFISTPTVMYSSVAARRSVLSLITRYIP